MKIRNDDATIDVSVDGNGDETLVLIHGFPLSREIWNAQTRALAGRYRVVRPDLRGMGASSVPDGPYLMETLAGDIAAVLDALALERATIVGHSLGGYVALAFARMYAERCERLALVCSRIDADSRDRAAWRLAAAERLDRSGDCEPLLREMLEGGIASRSREHDPDIYDRALAIARNNGAPGLAAMLRGMALRDGAQDIAPELTMPVLVLAGALDAGIPPELARATAAAFPAARLVVAPGSGHLPMLEEPEVVSAALAGFMTERPGGSVAAG